MTLNQDQIQHLHTFIEKHYVEWYDVQTELVDHLATGIETQWQTNPNLSFDDVLKTEFKKFGVCGFSDVVEEKTKALNKHYWLLIWEEFKAFFTLPKIILTMFLMWSYFKLLLIVPHKRWMISISVIILVSFSLIKIFRSHTFIKRQRTNTQQKWLFETVSLQLGGMAYIFNLPVQIALMPSYGTWGLWHSVIFSGVIIAFSIIIYIALYIASPQLIKTMSKQYPDYKYV